MGRSADVKPTHKVNPNERISFIPLPIREAEAAKLACPLLSVPELRLTTFAAGDSIKRSRQAEFDQWLVRTWRLVCLRMANTAGSFFVPVSKFARLFTPFFVLLPPRRRRRRRRNTISFFSGKTSRGSAVRSDHHIPTKRWKSVRKPPQSLFFVHFLMMLKYSSGCRSGAVGRALLLLLLYRNETMRGGPEKIRGCHVGL